MQIHDIRAICLASCAWLGNGSAAPKMVASVVLRCYARFNGDRHIMGYQLS